MKKRGFTLIELLAVIIILAIVALVAVPVILNVIDNAKKGALKDSVYNLTKAAENYIALEEARGNEINWNTNKITNEKYISFNLSNKEEVKKLNVKGSVPNKGRVEITKKGDTFVVAIDNNLCAKKNYGEHLVNLLSLNSDNICMLTASSDDLSSDDTNDIIATITNLSGRVEELENKNTTLENKVNKIEGETIDKIYPVGSIYISTNLNKVEDVEGKFGGEWETYGNGRVLRGTIGESGETGGLENVQLTTANLPEHSHSYTPAGTIKSTFNGDSVKSTSTGSGYSLKYNTTGTNNASTGNQSANHTHSIPALSGTAASSNIGPLTFYGSSTYEANKTGYSSIKTESYYANSSGTASSWLLSASGGAHAHTVTTNASTTGANSANHTHKYTNKYVTVVSGVEAHTHNVTATGTVSSEFTGTATTTNNTGSNKPFSVLDPYITVYMYKRVK